MLIRAYGLFWSADEVEWYGYLLGSYRIATAPEPNSSWFTSFKSIRLQAHGAELVGELGQIEDSYRMCYVRGPEGIIVGLAEQIG